MRVKKESWYLNMINTLSRSAVGNNNSFDAGMMQENFADMTRMRVVGASCVSGSPKWCRYSSVTRKDRPQFVEGRLRESWSIGSDAPLP